jgi:hypothetical protein
MVCTIFTGINQINLSEGLNVFPNPFNGKAELHIEENTNASVFVYDLSGKCLLKENFSGNDYTLDVSKINNYKGLIFVSIQTNKRIYSAKLISN